MALSSFYLRPAAIALAVCVATGSAMAQQPQPARPAAPAQKPAAPAAPAAPQAAPQQGQQAGPTVVQVKPEPSQTDWLKVCGEDPGNKKRICYTTRDFVSDQGQPVLAVAVYDIQGDPNRIVRFLMPLGLLLQPGMRFSVDAGQGQAGKFAVCFPNGCFAEGAVGQAVIDQMRKGNAIRVSVQNQFTREVTFEVPLTGFAKAFDGAPIDPKVLEEQQRQMQEQMQKQAEDLRKKLEGGSAAAPAPGAPATPPKP
jgi:invasion protein IalB